MAIAVHFRGCGLQQHTEPGGAGTHARALVLNVDAPRLVIGRGAHCEIQLPDLTVSQRHASLRSQDGRYVVIDEGSTNGVMAGGRRLPPHAAHTVNDGDLLRIGRLWIELRFGAAVPDITTTRSTARSQDFAEAIWRQKLFFAGEFVDPCIEVIKGPDRGLQLRLSDPERDYVIGRSRDADLVLCDPLVSRTHICVRCRGVHVNATDMQSKRGGTLDDISLTHEATGWTHGHRLAIGQSELRLSHPLADDFEQLRAAPDVRMHEDEYQEPPPVGTETNETTTPCERPSEPEATPAPPAAEPALADGDQVFADRQRAPVSLSLDVLVAVVAIGMMGASAAGMWWVLG